jgi:deoxyribonuclease-2
MTSAKNPLSAIDDHGNPVDWWFLYKVAGKSVVTGGPKATGNEYIYFDSSGSPGTKLILSPNLINDPSKGTVSGTLNQIYNNLDDPDLGWFFYNDEDPTTDKTNSELGHTKGVLCFDLATNSAFWMIHSAPKFALQEAYGFPETATGNGQSFLCITLKDADTAQAIAAQMYVAQQPNVYFPSKVPAAMDAADPRAKLINKTVAPGKTSYGNFITFLSKGGQSFKCIARNKYWDTVGDDDFYNDLVGPALAESIEVETWEHDPVPGDMDDDKVHTVVAMKEVDLAPLGITPSYAWSEENDHAKLAVSDQSESIKYVCVGDLNFTVAQEKRSGGTVAFINDDLWSGIFEILSATVTISNSSKARTKDNG